MIRFTLQKLWNKRRLNLCLMLGLVMLVASFAMLAMFREGAYQKLLQEGFHEVFRDSGDYPAALSRNAAVTIVGESPTAAALETGEKRENTWLDALGLPVISSEKLVLMDGDKARKSVTGKSEYVNIGWIADGEEFLEVKKGVLYTEAEKEEDTYPCVVSEQVMDSLGLAVGEVLTLEGKRDESDAPLIFRVVGIVAEKENEVSFWEKSLGSYERFLFVSQETMDEVATRFPFETVRYSITDSLDYRKIGSSNAAKVQDALKRLTGDDGSLRESISPVLIQAAGQRRTVEQILFVITLPLVMLLLMFIYMISSRIVETESGEMAVLRSRGISRPKLLLLYMMEILMLSLFVYLPGILLGAGLCRAAASTNDFMVFVKKSMADYPLCPSMLPFGLIGALMGCVVFMIPVIRISGRTITDRRNAETAAGKRNFWEKYFVDVLLLGLSIYLLFNYNKQKDALAQDVIGGKGLDPLVFLSASLFIFAGSLLILRLLWYLVRFIFFLGKKHWKPAEYAAFLQITRTRQKSALISIFLIFTVALGIFHANMARTINENNGERIRYNDGAGAVVKEDWRLEVRMPEQGVYLWNYPEPDYGRYTALKEQGVISGSTRVVFDDQFVVRGNSQVVPDVKFMAINTKEFGEVCDMPEIVNHPHWYHALNELSQTAGGIIISRNLADLMGLEVGQTIAVLRYSPITVQRDQAKELGVRKIVAIVDAFPGYERYSYSLAGAGSGQDPSGTGSSGTGSGSSKGGSSGKEVYEGEAGGTGPVENYLVVGNYASEVSAFGLTPYEVWMRPADGISRDKLDSALSDAGIHPSSITLQTEDIRAKKDSSIMQITNGLFTITFLISILLLTVGFLIFWITSIKSRELLFGIYRAMGIRMKEISRMLVHEQIWSSLAAFLAGGAIGYLATGLFASLYACVYLPEKHVMPLQVFLSGTDALRLGGIFLAVFVLVLLVLRRIVKSLRISEALKLGED